MFCVRSGTGNDADKTQLKNKIQDNIDSTIINHPIDKNLPNKLLIKIYLLK